MSILLFILGALAVMGGALMAGFGVPVSEFSFGNTLIIAGATTAMGGFILIVLGAVVSKLQRIAETLATTQVPPMQPGRAFEPFEAAPSLRAAPAAATGRIPFPPKPKPDTGPREPQPFEPRVAAPGGAPADEEPVPSFAPTLRNPDEPPVTVEDDVSLSPQQPGAAEPAVSDLGAPARPVPPEGEEEPRPSDIRQEPTLDAGWHAPPPPLPPAEPAPARERGYFDSVWPAGDKTAKGPAGADTGSADKTPTASESAAEAPARSVAVLKSGVVDGMAYTLYVDGSIEAELPQGTLRFASINELRSHLEKDA